jgi:GMP synthase (glutamine-hydrolysing)
MASFRRRKREVYDRGTATRLSASAIGKAVARIEERFCVRFVQDCALSLSCWQAFAVLLPVRSFGVTGDAPQLRLACALRAVTSTDGMTADSFLFSPEFLDRATTRIINEVCGINRVVYDVTSKPPGTIEWG